jgi:hypothetical protein
MRDGERNEGENNADGKGNGRYGRCGESKGMTKVRRKEIVAKAAKAWWGDKGAGAKKKVG